MKYDDVDWHHNDSFPEGLSATHARTHIAIFLGWAISRGLEGEILKSTYPGQLDDFRRGIIDSKTVLSECCDDKITNDDLSDTGNAFALAYYESTYLDDYVELSDDDLPSVYHEPYTAEKIDKIYSLLDNRYKEWDSGNEFT